MPDISSLQGIIEKSAPWMIIFAIPFLFWKIPVWKTKIEVNIENIKEKIDGLESKHDSLESKFGNFESKFGTLESKFGTLESKFGTLESKVGNLESMFRSLESKVGNLESMFRSLESKVGSLDSKVGSLDSKVGSLGLKVKRLESKYEDIYGVLVRAVGIPLEKRNSPLALTDFGNEVSERIGAADIAKEYAEKLFPRTKGLNSYQVQEFCFEYCEKKLLENLKTNNPKQYEAIHSEAFDKGLEIEKITRVIGMELRDAIFLLGGTLRSDSQK